MGPLFTVCTVTLPFKEASCLSCVHTRSFHFDPTSQSGGIKRMPETPPLCTAAQAQKLVFWKLNSDTDAGYTYKAFGGNSTLCE